ncbi:MAG: molybdenum cofactor guanylyltransferase [Pseudomonadota bacterium]|nr:molybdenum cofactor guanylyltransferase [Pseudomonadota bacterium]MDO7710354.1 molybdenum cofactor guanylyltransferase [Pseudomonadota bacterium]
MNTSSTPTVTGVILAGGQARRMGGEDKGLILFNHKPLIAHVISTLKPQVDTLVINANRNIDKYKAFKYPVISDSLDNFCGPLAGMLSAMQTVDTDYILTAPCDSPNISTQLRQRMMETLLIEHADIAVAHNGDRLQPVFCLIPCRLHPDLESYLQQGGRKIDVWLKSHALAIVDFSDQPNSFINVNHPEDLVTHQTRVQSPIPLIGFAAFSGTGKTTLLRQLIPALNAKGLEVAVIKHAHHNFDIDVPGKDSYEIRQAGAQQVLVSSSRLMALVEVQSDTLTEPSLSTLVPRLDCSKLDLILVEGFKHESIAKVELHRCSLDKPFLYPADQNIIAIASDQPLDLERNIEQLDINDIAAIADYLAHFIESWTH